MNIYIVTAYRWGHRDNHSYVVGAFSTKEQADQAADTHVGWRGGKYGCEVVECDVGNTSEDYHPSQVSYFESPYYGAAGRHSPSAHPADRNKPPEFDNRLVCAKCYEELPQTEKERFEIAEVSNEHPVD